MTSSKRPTAPPTTPSEAERALKETQEAAGDASDRLRDKSRALRRTVSGELAAVDEDDRTPVESPDAKRRSSTEAMPAVDCPKCKGLAVASCPCCRGQGKVPSAKRHFWLSTHPEDDDIPDTEPGT